MKLIGSITENQYREEIEVAIQSLAKHKRLKEIFLALGKPQGDVNSLLPLDFFSDDGADFLRVLVDSNMVFEIDLPWDGDEPVSVEGQFSVEQYSHKLSKSGRIKIAVAKDIAASR